MAAANAPITMREVLTLPSLGINQQFITFTHVTMESEKYICVRETWPQNSVVIIDMTMPMQPLRRPITADSALMNPNSKILALKAQLPGTTQDHLQIFVIELKAKIKSDLMPEQVVFWKWITPKMLGLVTQTSVYHWSIEGDSEPAKMFDRTANLSNNQIINYRCDPSEKWLVLIGIEPGSPERPQLVKGNMQLFSVDQQRSQALEAHASSFASFKVPGNENPSILMCFASKTTNAGQITSKLHVFELGAQPGKPGFTNKQGNLFFPPDFTDDFPVAMQISHKYSLIYVITKLGLLFVYDLETATAMYRNRISPDPIFLTTEASTIGGFYAVNRRGQVLLANVNESTLVPFVSGQLNNLELAISLAKRGNLPGAENLMDSGPSSTSNKKLKFLCSFGGKILPRPRDRKLRYVGGETRIIRISQDSTWQDLMDEMMRMYGQPLTIKYQLLEVGEDFHCLLSVSCDEDLEDMMENGVLDGGGSQKLFRLFLFSLSDDGDEHLGLTMEGDSRSQYLSAVNGIDLEVHQNNASRGFHSEPSNPRAQAELLNHLSKAEAANQLDHESHKPWDRRTQRSGPAALEDGFIEFEKDIELANSVAKSNKTKVVSAPQGSTEANIPHQPVSDHEHLSNPEVRGGQNQTDLRDRADLAHLMEKAGKSLQTISENAESTFEDDVEFIFDTSVGKIDLTNLQVMDNKDLEELKELGSGAFGTVYQGKWRGTDVAIKRINKNCFAGRQDRMILESLKEAGILANLLHPNVVSLYGFVLDELGSNPLAIVTELVVDGSLRNILLQKDMYLDHYKRLIIAKGAASGMEYLHLKKIVHFDLKCDNLLVDLKDPSWPICKVADFGLSKVKKDSLVSGGVRGTLPWMAPELLGGDKSKVSEKVDVFSFGIVMWEILTGDVPYAGMLEGEIIGGIFSDTLRPPVPVSCDPGWRRLMEDCWAFNPQRRPSFTQIARRLQRMLVASRAEAGK